MYSCSRVLRAPPTYGACQPPLSTSSNFSAAFAWWRLPKRTAQPARRCEAEIGPITRERQVPRNTMTEEQQASGA